LPRHARQITTAIYIEMHERGQMIDSAPQRAPKAWHSQHPAVLFAALAVVLSVGVVILAKAVFGVPVVSVLMFAVICGLCLYGMTRNYPHDSLGWCNVVTLIRVALVSVLAAAVFAPNAPWAVFVIAIVAFASDGLDGWLARRAGLSSVFGARFDMEADALLGAVLALVLLTHDTVGPAILVLGFSRYAFVAAGWVWPVLRGDLPESYRRKVICVVQIAALIALTCPLTPQAITPWIGGGAAGLLLYSFAVDVSLLMRRRS